MINVTKKKKKFLHEIDILFDYLWYTMRQVWTMKLKKLANVSCTSDRVARTIKVNI